MANSIKSVEELIELLEKNNFVKLTVRAIANSKSNSIEFLDEFVKIKINQKAVDNQANKAIIEFLAKMLNIAKSKIEIINGSKSNIKTISIRK